MVTKIGENNTITIGLAILLLGASVAGAHYSGRLVEGIERDRLESASWRTQTNAVFAKVVESVDKLTEMSAENERRIERLENEK